MGAQRKEVCSEPCRPQQRQGPWIPQAPGVICQPGNIIVTYGAASTGQIDWIAQYQSLGGTLVAAAA